MNHEEPEPAPERYRVLAVGLAAVLLVLYAASPNTLWTSSLWGLGLPFILKDVVTVVLVVAAPLATLRSVWAGTVYAVAAATLGLVLLGGPFLVFFVALLAVMVVATGRDRRASLVVGLLLWAYLGLVLVLGRGTFVLPGATSSYLESYGGGPGPIARWTLVSSYAVGVLLVFWAALLFRSSAVRVSQLRQLQARSGQVEETALLVGERVRLAHDLHDVVTHHVSLIAVRAETAPYTHPGLTSDAKGVLAEIATDARSALDELRDVLGVMRRAERDPAARSPQPGVADIGSLVARVRAAGERVTLDVDASVPLTATVGYAAFRVVQEALTNARRHAPGRPVHVVVAVVGTSVVVRVTNEVNDEVRIPDGGGRGIVGMRERVEALGGTLDTGLRDGEFMVAATLPQGADRPGPR